MLARKNRLSLTDNYQKLKNQGKWLNSPLFNFLYLFKLDNAIPQIAIVAGNKISTLATRRNRVKRLIGEAVRPILSSLPPNLSLAIFAKKEIMDKNLGEIKTELGKALKLLNNETMKQ